MIDLKKIQILFFINIIFLNREKINLILILIGLFLAFCSQIPNNASLFAVESWLHYETD